MQLESEKISRGWFLRNQGFGYKATFLQYTKVEFLLNCNLFSWNDNSTHFISVPQAHLPSSSDEPRQLSRDYSSPRSGNSSDGGSSVTNGVTILPAMKIYKNGSTSSSSPTPSLNDNPVNLTVKKNNNVIVEDDPVDDIGHDQAMYIAQAASQLGRKRRKQTHVPDDNKDEKYWARRLKNNEAAKKSRDMRIKREKVIFEENIRLETMVKELRSENENLLTENKELHLKLGLILDENARLKSMMSDK